MFALNTKTDHSFSILVGKKAFLSSFHGIARRKVVLHEQTFGLRSPAVNRTEKIWVFLETWHYRNNFLLRESYCVEENSRIIDENSGLPTMQGRILTICQPRSPRMP